MATRDRDRREPLGVVGAALTNDRLGAFVGATASSVCCDRVNKSSVAFDRVHGCRQARRSAC